MARAIKISSVSGALTVTITGPNGGTPTVYADSQLANTLSMPATIADTATTSFWLPGPGKYTLSVKTSGGTEIAADNNSTRTVDLETDSSVAALNYDARTLATVSGDSGHSTAGSAASGLPQTIVSKTANYTALAGDFVEGDTTSAGFAVTLPANPAVGALVSVKKVSSDVNVLTITPSGGGTIDGDANATTTSQWSGATFEHKGSNVWRIAAAMQVTGPQGAAGPTGTPGAAATVTVGTTTTGAAGSNAAVTNSGSTSAAILNFTVPAGATGATGPIAQIQGNGTNAAVRPTLDFEGSTVTVTDDAGNSRTKVTIAGGGAGGLKPLFRSGAYTTLLPSVGVGSGGNNAVTAIGQIIVFPFYLDGATTFNSMAMHVWSTGVASATLRVGFYNDSSGLPGTLLADLGTMSAAAGGAVTATISQAVPAGRNWCAFVQQGGASIFQSYTSGVSGLVGDASASPLFAVTGSPAGLRSSASTFTTALPGTFPTLDTVTVDAASLLRIVFKAA